MDRRDRRRRLDGGDRGRALQGRQRRGCGRDQRGDERARRRCVPVRVRRRRGDVRGVAGCPRRRRGRARSHRPLGGRGPGPRAAGRTGADDGGPGRRPRRDRGPVPRGPRGKLRDARRRRRRLGDVGDEGGSLRGAAGAARRAPRPRGPVLPLDANRGAARLDRVPDRRAARRRRRDPRRAGARSRARGSRRPRPGGPSGATRRSRIRVAPRRARPRGAGEPPPRRAAVAAADEGRARDARRLGPGSHRLEARGVRSDELSSDHGAQRRLPEVRRLPAPHHRLRRGDARTHRGRPARSCGGGTRRLRGSRAGPGADDLHRAVDRARRPLPLHRRRRRRLHPRGRGDQGVGARRPGTIATAGCGSGRRWSVVPAARVRYPP